MEKLNIAEILKDCPKGMKLDCAIYENVELDYIEQNTKATYPIHCLMKINGGYNAITFTNNGCNDTHPNAKCVILPKGKTTWEGFVPPYKFKDGDILATDLGSVFYLNTRLNTNEYYGCYVGIGGDGSFHICEPFAYKECCGLATSKEKQKLFDAIKANGYKWNEETKTLEELIKPKFKVGDWVEFKYYERKPEKIIRIENNVYYLSSGTTVMFQDESAWDLTTNKFDINILKPFDKVLVRYSSLSKWSAGFFSHTVKSDNKLYFIVNTQYWNQCIPYKGNEHLRGTTNDCDEYYKTWE